jgi:hypothetical protein
MNEKFLNARKRAPPALANAAVLSLGAPPHAGQFAGPERRVRPGLRGDRRTC